jgi:hypothetical protein
MVDIANSAVCIYGRKLHAALLEGLLILKMLLVSPNGLGKDAWTVSSEQITAFLRVSYSPFLTEIC